MTHPGTSQYLLGAVVLACLGLVACGKSSTSAATSAAAPASTATAPPAAQSSAPAVATDSSSTPDPVTSPSTTSPAPVLTTTSSTASGVTSVRACTSDQITTTYTPPDHGAGQAYIVLLFTNTSQATCTLQGYPGAAGLNSSGHQIAQAVRTPNGGPTPPSTVLLMANTVASATIHGSDVGAGAQACPDFASLLVTPPNTTRSVPVTAALPSCAFQIYPVVAGAKGSNR